jgi:hypothetical protein
MRTADRRQDVIILEIVNSDFLLILPFCFDHTAIPITLFTSSQYPNLNLILTINFPCWRAAVSDQVKGRY